MCLIVDANKLADFLEEQPTRDSEPIHNWLRPGRKRRERRGHAAETSGRRGGVVVYATAGKFRTEVSRAARARLEYLRRAGRAKLFNESELEEGRKLVAERHMTSDDLHVLALAAVSRARVVYTGDNDLMNDFRNRKVMGGMAGSVYSGWKTRGLLRPDMCDHLCK